MSRPSRTTSAPAAAPLGSSTFWWCALLALAVFAAYLPALRGQFLWDDDGHVTRADLRSLGGLLRIWFEVGATQQYYPVLHSAFWLEHRLWGDAPLGYHLVNLLQHAANACLFALVLRRLAVPGAWFAAALFALHPACVESVAWISEQKNTLSALFYLSAALAWLRFDDDRRPRSYALASALFVLALLTKTVTASLPAALLVVAWWRRGRLDWRRDVLPLLPWFAAGAAMGLLTAHFESELIGAKGSAFELGVGARLLLAARVPWHYVASLVWPFDLTFIYPRWNVDAAVWWQWLFPLATLGALGGAAWRARLGNRGWLAAALLFGGTLFPVLGFVNVYPFLFSFVADHFAYLANLALFALAGAGAAFAVARFGRGAALGAFLAVLGGLFALTWSQAGIYRDEATLWRATLARNPDCWLAHNNLALVLAADGERADAVTHLEAALRLRPDFPEGLNNLAGQLVDAGRAAEAKPIADRALALLPKFPAALNTRGRAALALGDVAAAERDFTAAVQLDPRFVNAWCNRGVAAMSRGRPAEALPHFTRAAEIDPANAQAAFLVGATLVELRRPAEAVPRLERALELDPEHALAHRQLARALRSLGRIAEAAEHERAADEIDASRRR